MKFNFKLDEALFDDDSIFVDDDSMNIEYDDFSDSEHELDNVLPGPAEGVDTGAATELIALINSEWEAIEGYNNAVASLRILVSTNPFYESAIKVLEEINAEENAHVGQLQEILKQISPNVADIQKGTQEAKSQLGFVGGVLPVQSWDEMKNNNIEKSVDAAEEICTISDIDDEM